MQSSFNFFITGTAVGILICLVGYFVYYFLGSKRKEEGINFAQLFQDLKNDLTSFLNEKLVRLEEHSHHISITAQDLRNLKELFAGPKTRGNLGEILLEDILKQFPQEFYQAQYRLGTETVDFVLKINEFIIPVDVKFPLEIYQKLLNADPQEKSRYQKELIRNLKEKINSISKKYILPHQGTVEFALLYLPAEGLYYEILSDVIYQEIFDFAYQRKVFLTSPRNFEIVCSLIGTFLRKQEIAKNIELILNSLTQLEKDLASFKEKLETSANQIQHSQQNLQSALRIFNRILVDFRHLAQLETKKPSEKIELSEQLTDKH